MMRLTLLLALGALLGGCVVPYGEVPPATPASPQAASAIGDLTGLEARVLLLLDENQDADRAARLQALRALLRRARSWPPQAQKDLITYLDVLLDVEERWREDEGMEGFVPVASVVRRDEPIGDDGPKEPIAHPILQESPDTVPQGRGDDIPAPPDGDEGPPVTVAPERDAAALRAEAVQVARKALADGSYEAALEQLGQLDDAQDEEVGRLWQEAVDGYVHAERERAGSLFLASRGESDPDARKARVMEVAGILRGLLESFPESTYTEAIQRNLQLVEQELESLR